MAEQTLKPCPFCGGTSVELANTHTPSFWVKCGDCEAEAHGEYFAGPRRRTRLGYDPEADPNDNFHARTIDELYPEYRDAARSAIEAWNRRSSDADVTELVVAVAALVDPPLRYNDSRIEIDCSDHFTGMEVVGRVRKALAAVRGGASE